ncbi:MAG: hypothetical protein ACLP50_30380 [Solirubrobacteraceae bacterium]
MIQASGFSGRHLVAARRLGVVQGFVGRLDEFTPTHASWLNQIEIFFSILYRRLLKHGIFTSERDLAQQMLAFVESYNQTAKPFKWTYTGKVLEA